MGSVFIYALECPFTNKIRYIGKSNNPKRRLREHCLQYRASSSHKRNWIKHILDKNSYPILKILEETTEDCWKERESYYIRYYQLKGDTLTNCTEGGDGLGSKGNRTSFKKGQIPWNKYITGYKLNKNGYRNSYETRKKISNSLKGVLNKGHSKKVEKIEIKTGQVLQIYPSVAQAIRETGIKSIANAANPNLKYKTAGGYAWRYLNC